MTIIMILSQCYQMLWRAVFLPILFPMTNNLRHQIGPWHTGLKDKRIETTNTKFMNQDYSKFLYRISSSKWFWHLFNFKTLRCGAYWRAQGAYFKVRGIILPIFQNFVNFSFQVTLCAIATHIPKHCRTAS